MRFNYNEYEKLYPRQKKTKIVQESVIEGYTENEDVTVTEIILDDDMGTEEVTENITEGREE